MIWLARITLTLLLVFIASTAWEGLHYAETLNALSDRAQQDDALRYFQQVEVSMVLALIWGLLMSLLVIGVAGAWALRLWPHAERRPGRDRG